ncbi:MAG: flagellar hook-basal body complex protein FliE [Pseudorhodobacter sp.]|nr:flagellar hook-basal body complex protein FliE [Pseudorhodobacter sp.]
MDVRASFAAQTYAQARSAAAPQPQPGGAGSGFAKLAGSFVETLAQGEQTARAAMTGGADPHALVQALAASELAVETAVTVRDKVVEAYQEILRMPV